MRPFKTALTRRHHVPIRTRIDLLLLGPRTLLRRSEHPIRVGEGRIHVSAEDLPIDCEIFNYVFIKHTYGCDYRDAFVLDIGAHKGYHGAYALLHGARSVHSFEPEARNFSVLERCASEFRARGLDWRTTRAAVGSEAGELDLRVGEESWGHSLVPPDEFRDVGAQRVNVVAMRRVLEEARTAASQGSRLIVKMNVEGSECDIVFSTPIETWRAADEVFVETHSWAPCTQAEIAECLAGAGFSARESVAGEVVHLGRA